MFFSAKDTPLLRKTIIKLYTCPFDQNLLGDIRKILCDLTDSQYFSLICFLRRPIPSSSKVFSNNPASYGPIYFSIMSEDFLMRKLLSSSPEEYVMVRNRDYEEEENRHFTRTAMDARPVTDIAYFKLHTSSIVNGVWAFTKNSNSAPSFSDAQLNIMRFVVPFMTDAFNRACIPPPAPEDVAYLDKNGQIVESGNRIKEAFDDLFGHSLFSTVSNQGRVLQNSFRSRYLEFLHGPFSVAMDRMTLRSEKRSYAFLFSLIHPQTIQLDQAGLPLASVRLLDVAQTMNPIQRVSIPQIAKRYGFTRRECEVILGIYRGESNKIIAGSLGVDESTIKRHTHNIYEKSGFRSRLELVVGLSDRS